jgi:hypothetical protein
MDVLEMLQAERDKLNRVIAILDGSGGGTGSGPGGSSGGHGGSGGGSGSGGGKRTMSAAARAKIAAGQRARWAKAKMQSAEKTVKKFVMSAEARAKISKAMKARWAAKK